MSLEISKGTFPVSYVNPFCSKITQFGQDYAPWPDMDLLEFASVLFFVLFQHVKERGSNLTALMLFGVRCRRSLKVFGAMRG
jgi:hypothetical protein